MASGRVVRALRHRQRAAIHDRGRKVRNCEIASKLTLGLAAGERGDERCGSGPAHRPFERRLASSGSSVRLIYIIHE